MTKKQKIKFAVIGAIIAAIVLPLLYYSPYIYRIKKYNNRMQTIQMGCVTLGILKTDDARVNVCTCMADYLCPHPDSRYYNSKFYDDSVCQRFVTVMDHVLKSQDITLYDDYVKNSPAKSMCVKDPAVEQLENLAKKFGF